MNKYWSLYEINEKLNNFDILKTDPNIEIPKDKFLKINDYFKILRIALNNNYYIPNELIFKILEIKYNLELNKIKEYNHLDLNLTILHNHFEIGNHIQIYNFHIYTPIYFEKIKSEFGYPKFEDIGRKDCGMGHCVVLAIEKKSKKYFIRHDGGSNGWECEYNHQRNIKLDFNHQHQDKLMTFNQLLLLLKEIYIDIETIAGLYHKKCIK